ncbi:hypothetical protein TNCV_830821 [Trichonephila clavipes]|nr:hypothetical protein TNCV_830821 [Trichonephila clavipes]
MFNLSKLKRPPVGVVWKLGEMSSSSPDHSTKRQMPLRQVGTINSHRAASPLVRLVHGEESGAPNSLPGCSPSKLGWNPAKSYCRLYGAQGCSQRQEYILVPYHDEFRRLRSDYVRQFSYTRASGDGPHHFEPWSRSSDKDDTRADTPLSADFHILPKGGRLLSFTFTCRNCGGGDRGRVAIYRPFGELRRAKIVLSPVWCSRPTTGVPLVHATMNFVGLDLTTSDRWH